VIEILFSDCTIKGSALCVWVTQRELGISPSAVSMAIARAPEILQREEINAEWLEYQ